MNENEHVSAINGAGGSGGWRNTDETYAHDNKGISTATGRCDVDVVEGMMASGDFVEKYLKVNRPVLMKNATLSGPTGLGVL